MRMKIVLPATVLMLLFSTVMRIPFIPLVRATTWTVDDDGPADFHTIQEAINNANDGDTIKVRSGTYYENVVMNKSLMLLGENKTTTMIDGNKTGTVVRVASDNVTVSGFTIQNSRHESGIYLNHSDDCVINGNTLKGNHYGIKVYLSADCTVTENNVSDNDRGITVFASNYCTLSGNNVSDNLVGIESLASDNCAISGNTVKENEGNGIKLDYSVNCTLKNNKMTRNKINIAVEVTPGFSLEHFMHDIDVSNTVNGKPVYYLVNEHDKRIPENAGYVAAINSTNITVENMNLTHNYDGVLFAFTSNSTVKNSKVSNVCTYYSVNCAIIGNNITYTGENWRGIYLVCSSNCTVIENNVVCNVLAYADIKLHNSSDNIFFHNNFINITHVEIYDSINVWDNSYPSGGNYWSDYVRNDACSGSYQNETDSDGIGDSRRFMAANNVDSYPLMAPVKTFDVIFWDGHEYEIGILSNSTVANFQFNVSLIPEYPSTISFNLIGPELTGAFCRIIIPNIIVQGFWNDKCAVLLNGEPWPFRNWTDNTNTYIYFIHQHPTHEVIIIPEFPRALILLLFMITTLLAVTVYRIIDRLNFPSFSVV